jgi:hypothetical protein
MLVEAVGCLAKLDDYGVDLRQEFFVVISIALSPFNQFEELLDAVTANGFEQFTLCTAHKKRSSRMATQYTNRYGAKEVPLQSFVIGRSPFCVPLHQRLPGLEPRLWPQRVDTCGRDGNSDAFHPPPRAWINATLAVNLRANICTDVDCALSSVACAEMTVR